MLVRRDLTLPQQAVQAAHAAIEAARAGLIPRDNAHPHLVLCHVASVPALMNAAGRLALAGVRFQLFHEPDWDGVPTALATEPLRGEARAPLRRFPLLKESAMSDRPQNTAATAVRAPQQPIRGRWGYYPCTYETWRTLKRLRLLWFVTVRRQAAWTRWYRKQAQNRVVRRRLCDAAGRPVGWERLGPRPEPRVPAFMIQQDWRGRSVAHEWVDALYREAHRPVPEPRPVWDEQTTANILELARKLEDWYAREGG